MNRAENPLAQYSFDPAPEAHRLNRLSEHKRAWEFSRSLLGYDNEVLKDRPVSIKYSYWFDPSGNLYNHPARNPEDLSLNGIRPGERGDLPAKGLEKVAQLLFENPGEVVLWYSPPGPAAFDDNPENPFSQITFDYGQLYITVLNGDRVENVALKITNEDVLRHFMPHIAAFAGNFDGKERRIQYFLTHPVNTSMALEEFLSVDRPDEYTHTNHKGEDFSLHEVISLARAVFEKEGFTPEEEEIVRFATKVVRKHVSEDSLQTAYFTRISMEMKANGVDSMRLAGSCGGRTILGSEVENLLGLNNGFSTDFRTLTQIVRDKLYYPDYNCSHCGGTLTGESKTDRNARRKTCDHCGGELNC
ncbi:hypothetical protein A2W49_01380 [Candidatus Roizmanbacteria bacterium RIFCSPHIGHO2_12_41_18]|nr:MAG: hypothetical protein A2W49_01380 [Candidatus Roizmanbacteria bacterium RIFCSPHIGHO2_12_41_18]OGK58445.1 MAG: hypothetical protein A3H84_04040 [Candidatus Roizmanbacteria bacterium RIFCSPLOWO2_02_FULL_40_13]